MQTRKHQEKFKEVIKLTHYIPPEIVDLIADYHDYDKYCKPKHQEKFKEVINDIGNMASIMPTIMPNTGWDLHLDRTLDRFYWSQKIHDIFEKQLIITVNSLHDIDRETDTDNATALEKKICKICKICSHLKDRSKKKTGLEYMRGMWIKIRTSLKRANPGAYLTIKKN